MQKFQIYDKETAAQTIKILVARKKKIMQGGYFTVGIFGIVGGLAVFFFNSSPERMTLTYLGLSIGILMILLGLFMVPRIYKNYLPHLDLKNDKDRT